MEDKPVNVEFSVLFIKILFGYLQHQLMNAEYTAIFFSLSFTLCRFILQSKGVIHSQLLDKQKIAEEKIKELEVSLGLVKRQPFIAFFIFCFILPFVPAQS